MPTPATTLLPVFHRLISSIWRLCFSPLLPAALAAWLLLGLLARLVVHYAPIFPVLGAELPPLTLAYLRFSDSYLTHSGVWLFTLCAGAMLFGLALNRRRWRLLRRWFPLFVFGWLYLFALIPIAVYLCFFYIPKLVR
jgi:type II secretory pathway component PulF